MYRETKNQEIDARIISQSRRETNKETLIETNYQIRIKDKTINYKIVKSLHIGKMWDFNPKYLNIDYCYDKLNITNNSKFPQNEIQQKQLIDLINKFNNDKSIKSLREKYNTFLFLMGYYRIRKINLNNHYRKIDSGLCINDNMVIVCWLNHSKGWDKIILTPHKATDKKGNVKYRLKLLNPWNVHHKDFKRDCDIDDIGNNLENKPKELHNIDHNRNGGY